MNTTEIIKECQQLQTDTAEIRNFLHKHPEISGAESQTLTFIKSELSSLEIPYIEVDNGGIIAELSSGQDGKTLLLRADIDGLPVQESEYNLKNKKRVISETTGVSHACGHDAHTAILLSALSVLSRHKDYYSGKILAVFERGEETAFGVKALLSHLIDQKVAVDSCFAIHVYSHLAEGKISVEPGYVMSGAVGFDVVITGKAGHSSRPDLCNNPTDCFVSIYNDLASIRMRHTDPSSSFTYAVNLLQGGEKSNVIPHSIRFSVLGRFFDEERTGRPFLEKALQTVELDSTLYDCEYAYNWIMQPTASLFNHLVLSKKATEWFSESLSPDIVTAAAPWMASESYSLYSLMYPSIFCFLGIQNNEGCGADHHTPEFDLNPDKLCLGVEATVIYAINFLNTEIPLSSHQNPIEIFERYKNRF